MPSKPVAREIARPARTNWLPYHASPIRQDYIIHRAGWCQVICPECRATLEVPCQNAVRGRGKARTIPIHDARRQLATEEDFGSIGCPEGSATA